MKPFPSPQTDSRAPLTHPPQESDTPSIGTVILLALSLRTFPSQLLLLLVPGGLGPCLFTFVTLDLAPNQYVWNEKKMSVERNQ